METAEGALIPGLSWIRVPGTLHLGEQLGETLQACGIDDQHLFDADVADTHELGIGLPFALLSGGDLLRAAVPAGPGEPTFRGDVTAPGITDIAI